MVQWVMLFIMPQWINPALDWHPRGGVQFTHQILLQVIKTFDLILGLVIWVWRYIVFTAMFLLSLTLSSTAGFRHTCMRRPIL